MSITSEGTKNEKPNVQNSENSQKETNKSILESSKTLEHQKEVSAKESKSQSPKDKSKSISVCPKSSDKPLPQKLNSDKSDGQNLALSSKEKAESVSEWSKAPEQPKVVKPKMGPKSKRSPKETTESVSGWSKTPEGPKELKSKESSFCQNPEQIPNEATKSVSEPSKNKDQNESKKDHKTPQEKATFDLKGWSDSPILPLKNDNDKDSIKNVNAGISGWWSDTPKKAKDKAKADSPDKSPPWQFKIPGFETDKEKIDKTFDANKEKGNSELIVKGILQELLDKDFPINDTSYDFGFNIPKRPKNDNKKIGSKSPCRKFKVSLFGNNDRKSCEKSDEANEVVSDILGSLLSKLPTFDQKSFITVSETSPKSESQKWEFNLESLENKETATEARAAFVFSLKSQKSDAKECFTISKSSENSHEIFPKIPSKVFLERSHVKSPENFDKTLSENSPIPHHNPPKNSSNSSPEISPRVFTETSLPEISSKMSPRSPEKSPKTSIVWPEASPKVFKENSLQISPLICSKSPQFKNAVIDNHIEIASREPKISEIVEDNSDSNKNVVYNVLVDFLANLPPFLEPVKENTKSEKVTTQSSNTLSGWWM